MSILGQVVRSVVAARAIKAGSSPLLMLAAGVLARRSSPLLIAMMAFLAARALMSRQPAPQRRRQVGRPRA